MPTIEENIFKMADMVATVKKQHHLTEATVMRIVDMNFALAQQAKGDFGSEMPWEGVPEPVPGENIDEPDKETDVNTGQLLLFNDNDVTIEVQPDDEEELIATTERKPN